MRPNVCISASTSNASSGPRAEEAEDAGAQRRLHQSAKPSMSRSLGLRGTAGRAIVHAAKGRPVRRLPAIRFGRVVVVGLILLDQSASSHRVALAVPVAADRRRAAAGLDHHVGEQQVGVDSPTRRAPCGSTASRRPTTPACSARRSSGVIATCVGNRFAAAQAARAEHVLARISAAPITTKPTHHAARRRQPDQRLSRRRSANGHRRSPAIWLPPQQDPRTSRARVKGPALSAEAMSLT